MGNETSKDVLDYERTKEYTFIGRQNEINEIKELSKTKVVVQIFGMTKIGKSRVLVQLLKDYHERRTCFYHDFNDDFIDCDEDVIDLIQEFRDTLEQSLDVCKAVKRQAKDIPSAIRLFKNVLKASGKHLTEAVLMLDNMDDAFSCNSAKDGILSFLKEISSIESSPLQIIFTTSEKVTLIHQHFGEIEIGRMEDEHIDEIIKGIIRKKGVTADGFDYAQSILGQENEVYMDIIAKQCEGLPLAAYMVAHELLADEGMLNPSDIVQLLFNKRVKSLSPEYYPREDRVDRYQKNIEKVLDDIDIYFFQTINRSLDANNRQSIDQLKDEFTKDTDKSRPDVATCFKLLTQPCIMKFLGKTRQLDMHVIFRECILNMTGSDSLDDDVFRSLLTENAKRYGMVLTDWELDNPKLLEEYVLRLGEKESSIEREQRTACEHSDIEEKSTLYISGQVPGDEDDDKGYLLPYTHTDLLPQTDEQTDERTVTNSVCDKCHKVKRSNPRPELDFLQEQPTSRFERDSINHDFCSCKNKMTELKYADSIEDNTAYPESDITISTASEGTAAACFETETAVLESRDLTGRGTHLPSADATHVAMSYAVNRLSVGTSFPQNDLSSAVAYYHLTPFSVIHDRCDLTRSGTNFPSADSTQVAMSYAVNRPSVGTTFPQNDLSSAVANHPMTPFSVIYDRNTSIENNEAQKK